MIIKYETDLSKQTFYESADRLRKLGLLKNSDLSPSKFVFLEELDNPVLALDSKRLEKLPNGKLIMSSFQDETPLTTFYGETPNVWYKLNGTWPCSIDTMVHLAGQRKSDAIRPDSLVLDMCCGTGMAGIDAMKTKNLASVDFSDITPECVASSLINYQKYGINPKGKRIANSYFVGDVFENIPAANRYNTILASAVPSTPFYEKLNRPINPLFEGTGVLESILRDAPNHLLDNGTLIMTHSLLGEQEFQKLAQKYGARVKKILYEKQVPFREDFLNSNDWVKYLIEEKGMIERKGEDHPYWHTVQTKEISF
jgi:tRNA1(Val) A37 N6-methylase TrmN6